jgi:hypothetical protein
VEGVEKLVGGGGFVWGFGGGFEGGGCGDCLVRLVVSLILTS